MSRQKRSTEICDKKDQVVGIKMGGVAYSHRSHHTHVCIALLDLTVGARGVVDRKLSQPAPHNGVPLRSVPQPSSDSLNCSA
jgi:hypothetical protein